MASLAEHTEGHPYYCAEGNYYDNGCHFTYRSLAGLLAELGDLDTDYNHVFRWDWTVERSTANGPIEEGDEVPPGTPITEEHTLTLHIVHQRKARLVSASCPVRPEDEPVVRAFLAKHADTVGRFWYGLAADSDLALSDPMAPITGPAPIG